MDETKRKFGGKPLSHSLRVFFLCTGVEIYNRGIESFFREAYDGLREPLAQAGIEALLFKGGGKSIPARGETRVWCLPRTGWPANAVGRVVRRSGYAIEQMTFLPGIIRHIRRLRPDVIFYSDQNAAARLYKWRKKIGVPYKLLYSNGAPMHPPFNGIEHVQQVAPHYYDEAIAAGEPGVKHSLVPYGIHVPDDNSYVEPEEKNNIRRRLNLPTNRQIILSVGAINDYHKRMDYTVREVAALAEARPFLVMLGAIERETPGIVALANELLGNENFAVRSVPYAEVSDYYRCADVFVLSSLKEGFGRVYLESLIHGLPTMGHDHPVIRYVLGDAGVIADLSAPGGLTNKLKYELSHPTISAADMRRRRDYVRTHFSWNMLAPDYARMFRQCAGLPIN
jgi:1,2-diacylglycerol 3-alpha-glucosyltransferase